MQICKEIKKCKKQIVFFEFIQFFNLIISHSTILTGENWWLVKKWFSTVVIVIYATPPPLPSPTTTFIPNRWKINITKPQQLVSKEWSHSLRLVVALLPLPLFPCLLLLLLVPLHLLQLISVTHNLQCIRKTCVRAVWVSLKY